jgi:hypothetical protein
VLVLPSIVGVAPRATDWIEPQMMTRIRAWLGGLLLSLALVHGARGQGPEDPGVSRAGLDSLRARIGFRVRVKDASSNEWHVGTLKSVNDETLILDHHGQMRFATRSLVEAQRSTGHARFNPTVAGFVVGMVAGGAAGVAIGNQHRSTNEPNGPQRSVGLAIGMPVGAGIGALIGAALAPEHWRDIRIR